MYIYTHIHTNTRTFTHITHWSYLQELVWDTMWTQLQYVMYHVPTQIWLVSRNRDSCRIVLSGKIKVYFYIPKKYLVCSQICFCLFPCLSESVSLSTAYKSWSRLEKNTYKIRWITKFYKVHCAHLDRVARVSFQNLWKLLMAKYSELWDCKTCRYVGNEF